MHALREAPHAVGWHVSGAYLTNGVRRYGFLDEHEQPSQPLIAAVTGANRKTSQDCE
jgi:hypothetical protein